MSGDPKRIMAMIEEKHGWRSDRPRMSEADAVATERSVTDMSSTGSKIEPREKPMEVLSAEQISKRIRSAKRVQKDHEDRILKIEKDFERLSQSFLEIERRQDVLMHNLRRVMRELGLGVERGE